MNYLNYLNYLNYFVFIIPFLFVYIPSIFFPVNNAGSEVPFRPPGIVFAIVWPILLLLIGLSWFKNINLSIYFFILSILLGIWTVIYNYSQLISFIEIIITLFLVLFLIFKNKLYLLIPLSLWLSFASILNGYQVIN